MLHDLFLLSLVRTTVSTCLVILPSQESHQNLRSPINALLFFFKVSYPVRDALCLFLPTLQGYRLSGSFDVIQGYLVCVAPVDIYFPSIPTNSCRYTCFRRAPSLPIGTQSTELPDVPGCMFKGKLRQEPFWSLAHCHNLVCIR